MIGSFWNLCRACPSMPVDKLHSEYRSTYRWHEYTGPRQEVVRRPPQTNIPEKNNDISASRNHDEDFQTDSLPKQEPAMPRRKKYPDLAYRHHEFISEERHGPEWRSSRRSKSEGPARGCAGGAGGGGGRGGGAQRGAGGLGDGERRRESDPDMENTANTGHTSRRDAAGSTPRKSHSMGALKARAQANAMVHKNRIDMENRDASELEPLVGSQEKPKQESHSEYQKKFRPFSQYEYSGVTFSTKENQKPIADEADNNATIVDNEDGVWYKEMVELRKKAGEYKHREWGSDLTPDRVHDIYNKQIELWDQVSRRSSLSALSLASMAHKTYTKEEKEDNNRKTSPTKAHRNAENSARMIRDIIKHHLEKTTGGSEYEGLIWSPTRDKLEPTIPRKDDDSRGSQKSSPKKSSPMKSSSLKRANQKAKQVRSQSVGPTPETNVEKRSPKRQSRSTTAKDGRKSSNETPSNKRPRPSSLNTTVSSRSKSSPVVTKNEDDRLAKPLQNHNKSQSVDSSKNNQKVATKDRKGSKEADQATENIPSVAKDTTATHEEHDSITYEPIIKSPPEPTRVKSPEQIIMRSPDPVNWTVPLDTGKTFTVTQNVREGDIAIRPHSEVKAWTPPVEVPPPVAQSAPPTLIEETKAHVGFS